MDGSTEGNFGKEATLEYETEKERRRKYSDQEILGGGGGIKYGKQESKDWRGERKSGNS